MDNSKPYVQIRRERRKDAHQLNIDFYKQMGKRPVFFFWDDVSHAKKAAILHINNMIRMCENLLERGSRPPQIIKNQIHEYYQIRWHLHDFSNYMRNDKILFDHERQQ